ncbi:permease [Ilumatobacter sp.]|uniref:permease n=1 Tax=Ilumatobacter sp. TaxID=1967498 RepID=UPI003C3B4BF9
MIRDTAYLVVELVVLFFGVAFAIQLLQRRVGAERLQQWLGGPPVVAALKGIAIGFATPFCTFSAVPMLIGFRRANVRTAGYVAFIVAAPVLDPVLFGALILIVGPLAATIYLVVAFTAALALALVADAVGIERHLKPLAQVSTAHPTRTPEPAWTGPVTSTGQDDSATCGAADGLADDSPWRGLRSESRDAFDAAVQLLRSVAVVLVIGVAIGILIEAFITPEMAARLTVENSILSIPIAAILGTPLYFSTALFVPIADALTAAGVGIGAIVALTISGAGASVPEFLLLTKLADNRILGIFFAYVLAVAVLGGLLAQALVG